MNTLTKTLKLGSVGLLLHAQFLIPAWSQETTGSVTELRALVRRGDRVRIVETGGQQVEGRVAQVTATSFDLTANGTPRTVRFADVSEVRREGHVSPALGGSLGAVGGAIMGLVICESDVEGRCFHSRGLTSGVYAGVGAGIGIAASNLIPQWRTVFTRRDGVTVNITPVLSRTAKAVSVSLSF